MLEPWGLCMNTKRLGCFEDTISKSFLFSSGRWLFFWGGIIDSDVSFFMLFYFHY